MKDGKFTKNLNIENNHTIKLFLYHVLKLKFQKRHCKQFIILYMMCFLAFSKFLKLDVKNGIFETHCLSEIKKQILHFQSYKALSDNFQNNNLSRC